MKNSEKLLALFSRDLQSHIVEFCKVLSKKDTDVYILFARKAACFISILEQIGLLNLQGKVVSDRVLDCDTEWLKNKSVTLIDDTIFSGTSLFKRIEKIEEIGVASLDIQVFCVDEFWFVPEMLQGKNGKSYLSRPYLILDHSTCLTFCKNIVECFSLFPRPYSTDFPIFEKLRFSLLQFHNLKNSTGWKIVDTSSKRQTQIGVGSFTMTPEVTIIEDFSNYLGASLPNVFFKLRFYTKKFEYSNTTSIYCRILPLVIFEPTSKDLLTKLVETICTAENIDFNRVNYLLGSDISLMRFAQYYIARKFFNFSIKILEEKFNSNVLIPESLRELELLFHPDVVSMIKNFSYSNPISIEENIESPIQQKAKLKPIKSCEYNPLYIKDILYKEFLSLYYKKELIARRAVKALKRAVFENDTIRELKRLDEGFTFEYLISVIKDQLPSLRDRKIFVSNFLDNGIDSGIIVPVTLEIDGKICRGYRHGEEIVWAENNDKLLASFYERFLTVTNESVFKPFWFEKLLVLFLKMGLKKGILQEYNYGAARPTETTIVAVKAYLQGEVTVKYTIPPFGEAKYDPILTSGDKARWTSSKLQELGHLKIDKEKKEYLLDTKGLKKSIELSRSGEPVDLPRSDKSKAEEIAELLAIAKKNKVLTSKDLVTLTSCLSLHDSTISVGAEISIFEDKIDTILTWVNNVIKSGHLSVQFLWNLRDINSNHAWTAVNSGVSKFLQFKGGEGKKLILKISDHFGQLDSFKQRAWDEYWPIDIKYDDDNAPDLLALNNEMGAFLIELEIELISLHEMCYSLLLKRGLLEEFLVKKTEEKTELENGIKEFNEKLFEKLIKTGNSAQSIINFKQPKKVKEYERQISILKSKLNGVEDVIEYWSSYHETNKLRIKKYLTIYQQSSIRKTEVESLCVNLLADSYLNFSEQKLIDEITQILQVLKTAKHDCITLLRTFGHLVPRWGKTEPAQIYTAVIHINTSEKQSDRDRMRSVLKSVLAEFELSCGAGTEHVKHLVYLRPSPTINNLGAFIGGKGVAALKIMSLFLGQLLKRLEKEDFPYKIVFYPSYTFTKPIVGFHNKETDLHDKVYGDFYSQFLSIEANIPDEINSVYLYSSKSKNDTDFIHAELENATHKKVNIVELNSLSDLNHNVHLLTLQSEKMPTKTIGVITALPVEFQSMNIMLDNPTIVPSIDGDNNVYIKGTIKTIAGGKVNVVLTQSTVMGTNNAATKATSLFRSFQEINEVLMVGIAGGVPDHIDANNHVRLGDIVISDNKGIIQYDFLKDTGGEVQIRDTHFKPSARLLNLCNILKAGVYSNKLPWQENIDKYSSEIYNAKRPDEIHDMLSINGEIIPHPLDTSRNLYPKVHYGVIASGNTLLKNEKKRDQLKKSYQIKAVEMESAGVSDSAWSSSKGFLTIRGIVDYCNGDKNDIWHAYSSVCAASYAKSLIELM